MEAQTTEETTIPLIDINPAGNDFVLVLADREDKEATFKPLNAYVGIEVERTSDTITLSRARRVLMLERRNGKDEQVIRLGEEIKDIKIVKGFEDVIRLPAIALSKLKHFKSNEEVTFPSGSFRSLFHRRDVKKIMNHLGLCEFLFDPIQGVFEDLASYGVKASLKELEGNRITAIENVNSSMLIFFMAQDYDIFPLTPCKIYILFPSRCYGDIKLTNILGDIAHEEKDIGFETLINTPIIGVNNSICDRDDPVKTEGDQLGHSYNFYVGSAPENHTRIKTIWSWSHTPHYPISLDFREISHEEWAKFEYTLKRNQPSDFVRTLYTEDGKEAV